MSRPEPRLVTKILSLEAVTGQGITAVYPVKIPTGFLYPGVVYQLIEDKPVDDDQGRISAFQCKLRISCLARESTGAPGYAAVKALALAILGDANPDKAATPSGIAGWVDTEGNVWSFENGFDEMGTIISGTDEFEAYVVNLIFTTAYSVLTS